MTRFHFIRPQGNPLSGELPSIHLSWIGIPIIGYAGGIASIDDEDYFISTLPTQRDRTELVIPLANPPRDAVDFEVTI